MPPNERAARNFHRDPGRSARFAPGRRAAPGAATAPVAAAVPSPGQVPARSRRRAGALRPAASCPARTLPRVTLPPRNFLFVGGEPKNSLGTFFRFFAPKIFFSARKSEKMSLVSFSALLPQIKNSQGGMSPTGEKTAACNPLRRGSLSLSVSLSLSLSLARHRENCHDPPYPPGQC